LFMPTGERVVGIVGRRSQHFFVGSPTSAESLCLSHFITKGDAAGCM
jgi:hypothetical protein